MTRSSNRIAAASLGVVFAACVLSPSVRAAEERWHQDTRCTHSTPPVGTVIASVLSPDQHKKIDGTFANCWMPADGTRLTERSQLEEVEGWDHAPDLRSVFLRGRNDLGGLQGTQSAADRVDPGGDRAPGSFQDDEYGSHKHSTMLQRADGGGGPIVAYPKYDNPGAANIDTSKSGGRETRPVNAAVYWYVKYD